MQSLHCSFVSRAFGPPCLHQGRRLPHARQACTAWPRPRLPANAAAVASAAAGSAAQPQQQPPSREEKARVASILDRAQALEQSQRPEEALNLISQELAELQRRGGGWARGGRLLRQRAVHLLFSAGDYPSALREARALHAEICEEAGEASGEARLFGLRRGVVEAAAGELAAGRELIHAAGAWVAPNLQRMVQQQQDEGGQGTAPLQDMAVRQLSQTLNECNCFGAMFTIKHLAQQGKTEELLSKWEGLEAGVVQCFTYLLLSLPPGAAFVTAALREHGRVAEELQAHPALGGRLAQQNAQLHAAVARAAEARGA